MTIIGATFEDLNVQEIISNWKFFANELLDKKLIAFRNIKIDRCEHHDLLYVLQNGGQPEDDMNNFCPTKDLHQSMEFCESRTDGDEDDVTWSVAGRGYVISKRRHRGIEKNFLQDEYRQEFFEWSVHVDTPLDGYKEETKKLQAYTSMYMTTFEYPEGIGKTYFASMVDMYEKLPPNLRHAVSNAFIEEWKGGKSKLEKMNIWPVLHAHPHTAEGILFYPGWNAEIVPNEYATKEICDEIKNWVRNYFLNSDNWLAWGWRENDFIMWDNRSLIHRFEGGWESDKRIFSQGGVDGSPPIKLF